MSDNPIGDAIRAQEQENALLLAAVEAMPAAELRKIAVVEYTCKRQCLLLRVVQTPRGLLTEQPPFTLSRGLNAAATTEAARARRTVDGERHWPRRVTRLAEDADADSLLELRCQHVYKTVPVAQVVADADGATPGRPAREEF